LRAGSIAPEYVAVANDSTYYEKAFDMSAKLEWTTTGQGLRPIKFGLPPGAQKAFASLAIGVAELSM
jgi:hypothetical protein